MARYKAGRFTRRDETAATTLIADLCCGIGGDLLALAARGPVVSIDCNPTAAHFAAANTGATVCRADVERFDVSDFAAWHIDPDRRAAGRRTTALASCQPTLATIERLLTEVPHAAVKLAPATRVPTKWSERCELEWISRDRECRQLVAWHGNLAQSAGQCRASVLPAACCLAARTLTGAPNQPIPIADKPDHYVFDVDPAVLAARLTGVLAAEHDLSALDSGPSYLTGPRSIDDAALACFEVADVLPLQLRKLALALRERSIGQLEIKKRGVNIDPERLRRDLKLRGDQSATLLITRIASRPSAILARRVS